MKDRETQLTTDLSAAKSTISELEQKLKLELKESSSHEEQFKKDNALFSADKIID